MRLIDGELRRRRTSPIRNSSRDWDSTQREIDYIAVDRGPICRPSTSAGTPTFTTSTNRTPPAWTH